MATSPSVRSRRSRPCSRTRRPAPNRTSRRRPRTSSRRPPSVRRPPSPACPEVRGPADAGPGRDPQGPGRGRGGASAQEAVAAAPRQCRPRPPRRESEPPIAARASGPSMPPLPERKPARTVAQQVAASEPVSEYAKQRPAPQGSGRPWRQAPVAPAPQGDDHLDIPAFLRRQANPEVCQQS